MKRLKNYLENIQGEIICRLKTNELNKISFNIPYSRQIELPEKGLITEEEYNFGDTIHVVLLI